MKTDDAFPFTPSSSPPPPLIFPYVSKTTPASPVRLTSGGWPFRGPRGGRQASPGAGGVEGGPLRGASWPWGSSEGPSARTISLATLALTRTWSRELQKDQSDENSLEAYGFQATEKRLLMCM